MTQIAVAPSSPSARLSGAALKWIAVITMLIDHTGASLVLALYYKAVIYAVSPLGLSSDVWYHLYWAMRTIGRVAFPIFCFCLVEGFCHSSNKARYALRLGTFSLISEIPFDLALNNDYRLANTVFLEFSSQNVFFTLLLGFCALWLAEFIAHKCSFSTVPQMVVTIAISLPFACIAEYVLYTDYGAFGVLLIAALMCGRLYDHSQSFYAQDFPMAEAVLGIIALVIWCSYTKNSIEPYAAFGFVICLFYNGARGKGSKWFFYLFYPVHLLILGCITWLL